MQDLGNRTYILPKKGCAVSDIDCTGWLDSHDLNTVPTNDQPIIY